MKKSEKKKVKKEIRDEIAAKKIKKYIVTARLDREKFINVFDISEKLKIPKEQVKRIIEVLKNNAEFLLLYPKEEKIITEWLGHCGYCKTAPYKKIKDECPFYEGCQKLQMKLIGRKYCT